MTVFQAATVPCRTLVLLALLSSTLLGCGGPVPAAPPNPSVSLGQTLPLSAEVKIGDQAIALEVAETPEQQAMGLMYRDRLADNRGMLFPFTPARGVNFWMKNVSIHLDMIFLHQTKVVEIAENVPPCAAEPCPFYGPKGLVDQVIELRGGRAKELQVKVGDRLVITQRSQAQP